MMKSDAGTTKMGCHCCLLSLLFGECGVALVVCGETQDFASLLAGGGELLTCVKNWW